MTLLPSFELPTKLADNPDESNTIIECKATSRKMHMMADMDHHIQRRIRRLDALDDAFRGSAISETPAGSASDRRNHRFLYS